MNLFLVRHAQSANNAKPEHERVEDPGLTEMGFRQADHLASAVVELQLDRLITSPFRRTLETTASIVKSTSLVPEIWVDLHEQGGCYAGYHEATVVGRPGMTRSEIARDFPHFQLPSELDEQGWWRSRPYESFYDAIARAQRLLNRAQAELPGKAKRVAFIMHADFKMLLMGQIDNRPLDVPYNASITQLRVDPSEVTLVRYNQVDHLPESLRTC